jgi:hypothetical protein
MGGNVSTNSSDLRRTAFLGYWLAQSVAMEYAQSPHNFSRKPILMILTPQGMTTSVTPFVMEGLAASGVTWELRNKPPLGVVLVGGVNKVPAQ